MSQFNFAAFPDPDTRNAAFGSAGPNDIIRAGWIPPDERTETANAAHSIVMATTPALVVSGVGVYADATKAYLWECWEPAFKRKWLGVHQITGSCVGAGGGNALFSLAAADIVKRRDRERSVVPFWLLPYGISRMLAGMNDRGDGSLGSTFAQAVREYGHIPAELDGLPKFSEGDGVIWGEANELNWSQGRRIAGQWLEQARVHLVKSTAKCNSTDDVREALKNYYAVTIASNWGGSMRPSVKGSGANARLINTRTTTWNHQMSVQGWEDNPEHGELFYILNQWGLDVHGRCPSGAPPGGFWIKKNDLANIVSQDETFAMSQFDGFPALDKPLDFSAF